MIRLASDASPWVRGRIRPEEITRYQIGPEDFIDEARLESVLDAAVVPDAHQLQDILAKALAVQTLTLEETGALLGVTDPELLEKMRLTAFEVKKKVYDNRIVTFAPLYVGNYCVNRCLYCGFRADNAQAQRRTLSPAEVVEETRVLAGKIGHKRLIVVYGEHPGLDVGYMCDTIRTIYGVKEKARVGYGQIRRVNVNAPPLSITGLRQLAQAGLGTYQVFQETYHHPTYRQVHPAGTPKAHYQWRLYSMHRALEAGIDDVGIGALFGLYDWRFEVLGLVQHSRELEARFGIGPHTISAPRLEPADNAPLSQNSQHNVSDLDFLKLITVLRLAVPHAGLIITAREPPAIRRQAIWRGCTQTDASSRIGVGAYQEQHIGQRSERQQFLLSDTRTLDEVVRELAGMGLITSFCTAGYRCGRTGACIMGLLRSGAEGKFCKLNAVLTFREWLDDFASAATKVAGEKILAHELAEIRIQQPQVYPALLNQYERVCNGERDIYF
jgi:2-iminoacetate synthase